MPGAKGGPGQGGIAGHVRGVNAGRSDPRLGEHGRAVAPRRCAGHATSRDADDGAASGRRSPSPVRPLRRAQAVGGAASLPLLLLISLLFLVAAASACGSDPVDLSRDRDAAGEPGEGPDETAPSTPAYPGEEPAPVPAAGEEPGAESTGEPTAPAPAPPPVEAVRIYLVDLEAGAGGEDGEPAADSFGCGDRLRAVEVPVATEGLDTAERIAAALGALLEAAEPPAGLYDAFARSQFAVDSVEALPGVPGVFRIRLTGDLVLGGVCDHPRVRAQLEATARQFPGVEEVELLLSNRPLDAVLTGRG